MHCEDVFDILTRGPFPQGGPHDAAVEKHLAVCHDCRRMAEALRPAVSLFHECLEEGEAESLPGYSGRLSPLVSIGPVAVADEQVSRSSGYRRRSRHWKMAEGSAWTNLVRVGAAISLVIVAVAVVSLAGLMRAADPARPMAPGVTLAYAPDDAGLKLLRNLGLPATCLEHSTVGERTVCCTHCHAAQRQAPPVDSFAMLAQSCGGCHGE